MFNNFRDILKLAISPQWWFVEKVLDSQRKEKSPQVYLPKNKYVFRNEGKELSPDEINYNEITGLCSGTFEGLSTFSNYRPCTGIIKLDKTIESK